MNQKDGVIIYKQPEGTPEPATDLVQIYNKALASMIGISQPRSSIMMDSKCDETIQIPSLVLESTLQLKPQANLNLDGQL